MFDFLKTLLNYRKEYPELGEGKLVHFPPENGIYVYFKSLNDQKIMAAVNDNAFSAEFNLDKVRHQLGKFKVLRNIFSGESIRISGDTKIQLNPDEVSFYKLEN
jgi:hypothetical protein